MLNTQIKPYLNQNYEQLSQACISRNELFVDTTFDADNSSLFRACGNTKSREETSNQIVWKRPSQLVENPVFIQNNEVDWSNIIQGDLGNCWFISALVSVCRRKELCEKIIPPNQSFHINNYSGIFRFRFWHHGNWVEVVVDDRLPVDASCKDESPQLIFCRNRVNKNEFVGPLIEKAYAKLNTCYELLSGGNLIDALIDLTGGVHETFKLNECRLASRDKLDRLWDIVWACFSMQSLGGAVIKSNRSIDLPDIYNNNNFLSTGHSYCVLEPFEIHKVNQSFAELRPHVTDKSPEENQRDGESIRLLRMRDPWGEETWVGDWSRFSFKWTTVSAELQTKLHGNTKSNGQFYISFEDFIQHFDELYLVHTNLDAFGYSPSRTASINRKSLKSKWSCIQFEGSWSLENSTAAGCGNDDPESYWNNPKYLIKLETRQQLIISLIQTDQVRKRLESEDGAYESSVEPIAFSIYSIGTNEAEFEGQSQMALINCQRIFSTGVYLYKREINNRVTLESGAYILVPSVFDKGVTLNYILRVYYSSGNNNYINNSASSCSSSSSSLSSLSSRAAIIEILDLDNNDLRWSSSLPSSALLSSTSETYARGNHENNEDNNNQSEVGKCPVNMKKTPTRPSNICSIL